MMFEIKGYVVDRLSNWHYVLAERVRDASLIHDVCILAGKVHNNNVCPKDETEDILDDHAIFPDIVSAKAVKAYLRASAINRFVDSIEFGSQRHHDRNQMYVYRGVRDREDVGREGDAPNRGFAGDIL